MLLLLIFLFLVPPRSSGSLIATTDILEQCTNASVNNIFNHNDKQNKQEDKLVRCIIDIDDCVEPIQLAKNFNQPCKKQKQNVYVQPKAQSKATLKRSKSILKVQMEYQVLGDDKIWVNEVRWNTACYNIWTVDDRSDYNNLQANDSTTVMQCQFVIAIFKSKIIYINMHEHEQLLNNKNQGALTNTISFNELQVTSHGNYNKDPNSSNSKLRNNHNNGTNDSFIFNVNIDSTNENNQSNNNTHVDFDENSI